MPTPDQMKTKRPRFADRFRTNHQLTILEELTLCFGGRPIIAFAYMFGLVLMIGGLELSDLRRERELAPGAKRVLAQCGFALALGVSVVVILSCRKKTRQWLFDKDPVLVGRAVSSRTKWSARLLPRLLLAALVYLWSDWSR